MSNKIKIPFNSILITPLIRGQIANGLRMKVWSSAQTFKESYIRSSPLFFYLLYFLHTSLFCVICRAMTGTKADYLVWTWLYRKCVWFKSVSGFGICWSVTPLWMKNISVLHLFSCHNSSIASIKEWQKQQATSLETSYHVSNKA